MSVTLDYPRPLLHRDSHFDFNGPWAFCFDDENRGLKEKWEKSCPASQTIQVPFSYNSALSGIDLDEEHSIVWYQRQIEIDPKLLKGQRAILHFEGVDYRAMVFADGALLGSHQGGYTRIGQKRGATPGQEDLSGHKDRSQR